MPGAEVQKLRAHHIQLELAFSTRLPYEQPLPYLS
jgi:hypothetical protein